MGNGKVLIGNVHGTDHSPSFIYSVLGLQYFDREHGLNRLVDNEGRPMFRAAYAGAMQIPKGRNDLVAMFLETDAEWLLFVDSDMGCEGNALEMLVRSADPETRPVVGGLCFAHKVLGVGAARAFRSHFHPTLYKWTETDDYFGFDVIYDYPRDSLVQVAGTGAAFLLVHRTVFEKIEEHWPGGQWFRQLCYRDRDHSEDMSFCLRLLLLKIPLFVNTAVKTSHAKTVWIDEEFYDVQRRNTRSPLHVVIPVKDQLDMTRTVLRQLQQGGNYKSILVYDNGSGDEMREWLSGQDVADVYDASGFNIHEMWNAGIAEALSRDPDADVAILNNDLRLGPEFLARLQDGLHSDPSLLAVSGNYDGRQSADRVIPVTGVCAGRYDGTGGFAGFAFAIRNDFARTYQFPEDLKWWYGDNDMLATIEQSGGWYGIVRDAIVEHLDGGSVTSKTLDQDVFVKECEQDREWFLRKWQEGTGAADNVERSNGETAGLSADVDSRSRH